MRNCNFHFGWTQPKSNWKHCKGKITIQIINPLNQIIFLNSLFLPLIPNTLCMHQNIIHKIKCPNFEMDKNKWWERDFPFKFSKPNRLTEPGRGYDKSRKGKRIEQHCHRENKNQNISSIGRINSLIPNIFSLILQLSTW